MGYTVKKVIILSVMVVTQTTKVVDIQKFNLKVYCGMHAKTRWPLGKNKVKLDPFYSMSTKLQLQLYTIRLLLPRQTS